jgi:hypothetical protein
MVLSSLAALTPAASSASTWFACGTYSQARIDIRYQGKEGYHDGKQRRDHNSDAAVRDYGRELECKTLPQAFISSIRTPTARHIPKGFAPVEACR